MKIFIFGFLMFMVFREISFMIHNIRNIFKKAVTDSCLTDNQVQKSNDSKLIGVIIGHILFIATTVVALLGYIGSVLNWFIDK
jgi:hypothetical protein